MMMIIIIIIIIIIIKLQPSNTQPAISSKNGANAGPLCRSPENFNVFRGRPS